MKVKIFRGNRQEVRPTDRAGSSRATRKGNVRRGTGEVIRLLATALLTCCMFASPGTAGGRMVGLITKTD